MNNTPFVTWRGRGLVAVGRRAFSNGPTMHLRPCFVHRQALAIHTGNPEAFAARRPGLHAEKNSSAPLEGFIPPGALGVPFKL
jgi:hypothetical protein